MADSCMCSPSEPMSMAASGREAEAMSDRTHLKSRSRPLSTARMITISLLTSAALASSAAAAPSLSSREWSSARDACSSAYARTATLGFVRLRFDSRGPTPTTPEPDADRFGFLRIGRRDHHHHRAPLANPKNLHRWTQASRDDLDASRSGVPPSPGHCV